MINCLEMPNLNTLAPFKQYFGLVALFIISHITLCVNGPHYDGGNSRKRGILITFCRLLQAFQIITFV